uniref:RING-type domain-containing protein n=1 Tax=Peronospora matthiolae TaxID=2874970 RepID=A0AAV1TB26_9STRA
MIPIPATQFLPQTAADIPQHLYAPTQDANTGGAKTADDQCGCCHKSLFMKDTVKQTSCGHLFHARCIDKYLQKGLYCPVCHVQVLFPAVVAGSVYPSAQLPPRAVPVATAFAPAAGTHPRDYGTCRECGQTFYRDPTKVRPETNGWYRCQRCAPTDIVDFIRGSFCVLQ